MDYKHKSRAEWKKHEEGMRLNKFIAHSGLCSRRKAVDIVKAGKVTVNGQVEKAPARLIQETDVVAVEGKTVQLERDYVYFLMNKPRNTITTVHDPKGRKTVMEIIEKKIKQRIFPVGRLDRDTTGLLILTNDGALANKLTHPSGEVSKVYEVTLNKNVSEEDLETIRKGITLEDGFIKVDSAHLILEKGENVLQLGLHSGKNRIVRRICEHMGYEVEKLDRSFFAGMTKKGLKRGWYRSLTQDEVRRLKHFKRL